MGAKAQLASSTANGGSFESGFVSGALSSVVSSAAGAALSPLSKPLQDVGMVGVGGLTGGLGSVIGGGGFWSGVRQGIITSGLNHVMHAGLEGIAGPPKRTLRYKYWQKTIADNIYGICFVYEDEVGTEVEECRTLNRNEREFINNVSDHYSYCMGATYTATIGGIGTGGAAGFKAGTALATNTAGGGNPLVALLQVAIPTVVGAIGVGGPAYWFGRGLCKTDYKKSLDEYIQGIDK
jgi:hypothetical protein